MGSEVEKLFIGRYVIEKRSDGVLQIHAAGLEDFFAQLVPAHVDLCILESLSYRLDHFVRSVSVKQ